MHAHVTIAAVHGGPSVAHTVDYERLNADALTPPFSHAVVGGDLIDVAAAQEARQPADRLSELLW